MKLFTFTVIAYFLATIISAAQLPQFQWANQFGGNSYNSIGRSITVDALGNVYTTGQLEGTIDFDPGTGVFNLTSTGGNDIFISKLDRLGNFVWAKSIGGYGGDIGFSITVDAMNTIYVSGYVNETASPNSPGNFDIFIAKLDGEGNFLWKKKFNGFSTDGSQSIAVDLRGNVYITGYFGGTVNFDTSSVVHTVTSRGAEDIFILKLDSTGVLVWVKSVGGIEDDYGKSIAVDGIGNVYVTGFFGDKVDFDPGSGVYSIQSDGFQNIFILKVDSIGNFVWAKKIGAEGHDEASSISLDLNGNVIITGYFENNVDFDPGIEEHFIKANNRSVFILKLDYSGNYRWVKAMNCSTSSEGWGRSIGVDSKGSIYSTGDLSGTIDFDPDENSNYNLTSVQGNDIFISKLDSNGKFVWVVTMGGVGNEVGYSMALHRNGDIYTTGAFDKTVDFDPGTPVYDLTSPGRSIFVVKLRQTPSTVNEMQENSTEVAIYPNPGNTITTVSFGKIISNGRCKLINIIGQAVMEHGDIHGSSYPLDISTLAEGFYIIEVWDKGIVSRIPLVKH